MCAVFRGVGSSWVCAGGLRETGLSRGGSLTGMPPKLVGKEAKTIKKKHTHGKSMQIGWGHILMVLKAR